MSSVNSTPYLGSFVHLNVLNDQIIYIETLKLSITLCIFKHVQQELSNLFGSPTLCLAPLFGLGTATNSTIVLMEWTHCFFKVTSFRYLVVFQIGIPMMAWAVS